MDLYTDSGWVVHLHLGVQHFLLETPQGGGQSQLSLPDAGEVDGELGVVVVLVEHQHEVVVSPALGQQLELRPQ